jgi:hypothetical protein
MAPGGTKFPGTPADSFSKYKTNVIPKKVCILINNTSISKTVYFESILNFLLKMNQNRFEI